MTNRDRAAALVDRVLARAGAASLASDLRHEGVVDMVAAVFDEVQREERERVYAELGVVTGEDAERLAKEIANVCSPEESQRRYDAAQASVAAMGRPRSVRAPALGPRCTRLPPGWRCTREAGHEWPCSVWPTERPR
jgi:hypothetical protein